MKKINLILVLLFSGFLVINCAGTKVNSVNTVPQEVVITVTSTDPVTVDIEEEENLEATIWKHGLNAEGGGNISFMAFITPKNVVFNLYSGINVSDFIKLSNDIIKIRDFTDYRVVELNINSPGGSAFDGLSISDLIVKAQDLWGFTFKAHASGIIASAAVPIYAVCKERYATKGAIFMVHEAALWKWPGRETASDIRTQNKMMDMLQDQYTSYLVNNSKLSKEKWNSLQKETTWFTTEQAVEFGLVDFIE